MHHRTDNLGNLNINFTTRTNMVKFCNKVSVLVDMHFWSDLGGFRSIS